MSQLDPLPKLPFRLISKTIGRGAYASIKKAVPLDASEPVFAVKFINKPYALKHGRISAKQLAMEVSLHSHIGQHPNVIEWFASDEDAVWRWIAMEYAEAGDLFDKIEADVGVRPDVAQVYFCQLVGGVSFVHSKGVAHRDIKPENVLLSRDGNLKLADFGMATMFEYKGERKMSATLCGSPPYIAPEILACGRQGAAAADKRSPSAVAGRYAPELADVWSCGVVLFVLLAGNTPWDEPSANSWEFLEYAKTEGHSSDVLWRRVPLDALSLLRGMMCVDPDKRFNFARIRQHPWYTRHNPLLTSDGNVADPVNLATQMLCNLRIDFTKQPPSQGHQSASMSNDDQDMADVADAGMNAGRFAATQPDVPIVDVDWDFERPALRCMAAPSASLPPRAATASGPLTTTRYSSSRLRHTKMQEALADEPSMSQFSQTPGPSMTLTQQAHRFRDICPAEPLTRFFSHVPPAHLVQMLSDALHQLSVPLPPVVAPNLDAVARTGTGTTGFTGLVARIRVRALDGRRQSLHGEIEVLRQTLVDVGDLLDVRFVKVKGDPLEWRRFFKKVVVLCKDGVYLPDA